MFFAVGIQDSSYMKSVYDTLVNSIKGDTRFKPVKGIKNGIYLPVKELTTITITSKDESERDFVLYLTKVEYTYEGSRIFLNRGTLAKIQCELINFKGDGSERLFERLFELYIPTPTKNSSLRDLLAPNLQVVFSKYSDDYTRLYELYKHPFDLRKIGLNVDEKFAIIVSNRPRIM